jgi:polyhydroxyalkanoate synthesis regulator phasin
MAKKKDKDSDKAKGAGRADQVRSAVDQAFQTTAEQSVAAAEQGRDAAQDIVDQLAQAAGRVREVLDDLRPPTGDDVRSLKRSIDALERRVAALEAGGTKQAGATKQAAASKPAARKPATRKPAAKRSTATGRSASSRQSKSS